MRYRPAVRTLHKRFGVNAVTGRRYNPSVKTYGFATSPYTGEARSALNRRGEGLHSVYTGLFEFGQNDALFSQKIKK